MAYEISFLRMNKAKYNSLRDTVDPTTGLSRLDGNSFYFVYDDTNPDGAGELYKGSTSLTDATIIVNDVTVIPTAVDKRAGRFYIDKKGGIGGFINNAYIVFVNPKTKPVNYILDASTQPDGAVEGVLYFDGVNLGTLHGNTWVIMNNIKANTITVVDNALLASKADKTEVTVLEGYFTDGIAKEAAKLSGFDPSLYETIADTTTKLATKVDKVDGKGLSTNDYTSEDKSLVGGLTNTLATKADKTEVTTLNGYFTDGIAKEAAKLSGFDPSLYETIADTKTKLDNKVDKVDGKGLSTNDYDATAKAAVDGLTNTLATKADKTAFDDLALTYNSETKILTLVLNGVTKTVTLG